MISGSRVSLDGPEEATLHQSSFTCEQSLALDGFGFEKCTASHALGHSCTCEKGTRTKLAAGCIFQTLWMNGAAR